MSGVVFLPVNPDLPPHAFNAMVQLVNDCAVGDAVEDMARS